MVEMVLDLEFFWGYLNLISKLHVFASFISHNSDEIVLSIIFFSLWVMAYLADSWICSQVIVSEAKIILVNEWPLDLKDCFSTKVK